ncbi:hydantoinase B/oxoprolinase family protein [Elongatibacter sediminis]|uniref:Hydantoinase B/oxoprolinase family protein n=1 Tax=Elongatibacter sediminis TaxID=3119006 RepID=A0AAW9RHW9_9GAMM
MKTNHPKHEETAESPPRPIDAVEAEIFRFATTSVVDEIELNLTRTAFSELIYEYKDYCVGIVLADYTLLTQSAGSMPIFVGDLGPQVRDAVEAIGLDQLREGDVFLHNWSGVNGQHLNHISCCTPIFDKGRIVAYIVIRAHWADIGGSAPTSLSWKAQSVFEEGVQYRGLRVVREGNIVPDVMATIQANTRSPAAITGDLMAQIAGCMLGRSRWKDRVAERWTPEELERLIAFQAEASAELGRAAVRNIPDGRYEAACRLDNAGVEGTEPVDLHVAITISGDAMEVDFSGMPEQVATPINSGRLGGAVNIAKLAFKALCLPDRPADEWMFDALSVVAPPDTLVSASAEAPKGFWVMVPPTTVDLIFRAIGNAHPELVPAGHHGTVSGVFFTGNRESTGEFWLAIESYGGGFGATSENDGYGPLKSFIHGDNPGIPIELLEARFPLRIQSTRLRREAGGAGKRRGGPGIERIVEALEPLALQTAFDRTIDPPWGLAGGQPGLPGEVHVLQPGSDDWIEANKVTGLELQRGALVRIRTAGGGGWGEPEAPANTRDAA